MAVRRNIIVSPGISQLFPYKLKQLGFVEGDRVLDTIADLTNRDRRGSSVHPPMIDGKNVDEALELVAIEIGGAVVNRLGKLDQDHGGVEGSLGAELTTLLGWEQQLHNENALHANLYPPLTRAQATILYSHSWSGLLAAIVLKKILKLRWEMDTPEDRFLMIDGMCQRPKNPNAAMENLATAIANTLVGYEENDPEEWENTFIMTSGFKSVIPCMTIFSLLYGVEMIYTFEESDAIQRLHPRHDLNQPKSRAFWQETWKGMRSQHWADESANAYLRHALLGRLARPKMSFSSKG